MGKHFICSPSIHGESNLKSDKQKLRDRSSVSISGGDDTLARGMMIVTRKMARGEYRSEY